MESDRKSPAFELGKRTVIPRWKSPQEAVEIYGSDGSKLTHRKVVAEPWIKRLSAIFDDSPTPSKANELYETASVFGLAEGLARPVIKLAIKHRKDLRLEPAEGPGNGGAPKRASQALEKVNLHEALAREEIHRLRSLLAENPDRPFCWSELGRHYLVVAEPEKALRCMRAALQLAKRNRYLYRAATRLYVHVQDHNQALRLLRSEPDTTRDPWLLAAEIATASLISKRSRYLDEAKVLMSSRHFSDNQLSELAAAVGTVELRHGDTKRAKALFKRSLVAPTENSLAQAQWAVEQDSKIVIPEAAWKTPASYEARALAFRQGQDWKKALQACAEWLADEPFSRRPAIMGSYIGFRPEFHSLAEKFATAGLRCHSGDTMLLNNRAVARANQGNTSGAFADIEAAMENLSAKDDAHLMATLGMIAFRSGMPVRGREYYGQSIAWFLQSKDSESVASAILHLLREEIRIDRLAVPQALEVVGRIEKSPLVKNQPELAGMAKLIVENSHLATGDSPDAGQIPIEIPASPELFSHYASLFNVPNRAKKAVPRLSDLSGLV